MLTPEEIEKRNKHTYEHIYTLSNVSINKPADKKNFFSQLIELRLSLVRKYGLAKRVLDVGCGSGDYLFETAGQILRGTGIDFVPKSIEEANNKKLKLGVSNLDFLEGNARKMPFRNTEFDLALGFSSLYHMPFAKDVILEISRVLDTNGIAILELGNKASLNTIVCKADPEVALPCHLTVGEMKNLLKAGSFKILEWRAFQILPLWGKNPWWLRPLLLPIWERLLHQNIGHKMLDEWISSLPLIRNFSFRHMIVCQKI